MCLLLDHGLRASELALLKASDVDLKTGEMTFYRPKVKGTDQVAVSFGGDGSIQGPFFTSAANAAATWQLPWISVIENNAFQIWGLQVLTRLMDRTVFYLPNLGLVALIVGIGILVTNVVSTRTENSLDEVGFQHARIVGLVVKAVLLSLVGALALWQLAFAREIILGAFLIAFGSIGVAFALAVGIGAGRAIQTGLEDLFGKEKGKGEE